MQRSFQLCSLGYGYNCATKKYELKNAILKKICSEKEHGHRPDKDWWQKLSSSPFLIFHNLNISDNENVGPQISQAAYLCNIVLFSALQKWNPSFTTIIFSKVLFHLFARTNVFIAKALSLRHQGWNRAWKTGNLRQPSSIEKQFYNLNRKYHCYY